jgi:hypothetical protein
MRPVSEAYGKLWGSDWGLSFMLGFLVLAIFVAAPLVSAGILQPVMLHVAFSLLLVSGVFAVFKRRLIGFLVIGLVIAALAVRWVHAAAPRPWLEVASEALAIAALLLMVALVLRQVFRAGPVTAQRIQGAIVIYLLFGLAWAAAYELIEIVRPGSFNIPPGESGLRSQVLAYFSFVTLTTVGYGDVTAVHPVARGLVVAEALVGQLYPAILIARLVSMELISKTTKPEA